MSRGWIRLVVVVNVLGFAAGAMGQADTPAPALPAKPALPAIKFDVVAFKPCKDGYGSPSVVIPLDGDSIAYKCQPIGRIIYFAFGMPTAPFTMTGEPAWVDTDRYDFQAKVAAEDFATWQKMSLPAKRIMMRGTLADALNLKQHTDSTLHPAYNLVIAKGGIKFSVYKDGESNKLANGRTLAGRDNEWLADGTAVYQGTHMSNITEALATRVGRQVIDKTGLKDLYDITLFLPLEHYDASRADAGDSPIPMIFDGLKKIGLELQATKAETGGLVIDHIDRPPVD
jgi:uncharacterized protein (TIGR03435 family)